MKKRILTIITIILFLLAIIISGYIFLTNYFSKNKTFKEETTINYSDKLLDYFKVSNVYVVNDENNNSNVIYELSNTYSKDIKNIFLGVVIYSDNNEEITRFDLSIDKMTSGTIVELNYLLNDNTKKIDHIELAKKSEIITG